MESCPALIGIDDGYFPHPKSGGSTVLAGVLWSGWAPRDCSLELIEVDGLDGTEKALRLYERLLPSGARDVVILLDGISVAGFNFVDPVVLEDETGSRVLVIFKKPLDLGKIEAALRGNFRDWELRLEVYAEVVPKTNRLVTKRGVVHYYSSSMGRREALRAVECGQVFSPTPEPLRLSHMLATEVSLLLRRLKLL